MGAAVLTAAATLTPALAEPVRTVAGQPALLSNASLLLGPSGVPIPSEQYVTEMTDLYITPNFPDFTTDTANPLFTPEGLYPFTGVKSLELTPSVDQGLSILTSALTDNPPGGFAGNDLVVLGWSQSAIIASLLMTQLHEDDPDYPVSFVLMGNEMNPNGGLLERFVGLQMPSLGINFYGATPDNLYENINYTLEYDGFADFPRYPLNVLADINALLGIVFVHGNYEKQTPETIDGAIKLDTEGPTLGTYYMIPTEDLPLLEPLRMIPVVGNPIADLIQPDLRVLVNLGYGDPEFGWSTSPANIPTPFGLFPSLSDFAKVPELLAAGTEQGIQDFISAVTSPNALALPNLSELFPDPGAVLTALSSPVDLFTDVVNALTSGVSAAYATLLPIADLVNAVLTTLPMYNVNLFVDALQDGDLVGAIGYPIAADVGLLTMAGGIGALTVGLAVESIVDDFNNLF